MLLLMNIDLTIKNVNDQFAKDVTSSKRIVDIIVWYENNQGIVKRDEKVTDDVDAIQEELDSNDN